MGTNKIDPKKIIKEIFGNRISLKTDFFNKTDLLYCATYQCI